MRIAILGSGNVGGTLGVAWAGRGQEVVFGVRDPGGAKVKALLARTDGNARAVSIGQAVRGADVIVLATPWDPVREILNEAGDLSGRVLLDCTNPLMPGLTGLEVGTSTSGAEYVEEWAPGAQVVKIFNTVGYNVMANPQFGADRAVMFYCGDSVQAKETAAELASSIGFDAVDAGPLRQARLLEPLALLWITMSRQPEMGREFAFKLITRR